MTAWRLVSAVRNHKGILRANNEDNFYLNGRWMPLHAMNHGGMFRNESSAPFQVYAVCDGMGGETAGERASHEAVRALYRLHTAHLHGMADTEIVIALHKLSDEIFMQTEGGDSRSGTTLTACFWHGGVLRVVNVGDSRVYRLRGGRLSRLTADHSEVQRLVDLGLLTPDQARFSPKRHILRQYIGLPSVDEAFQPYVSAPMEARSGDRYLLCSDGLVDMVEDKAIRRVMLLARDEAEAAETLVQQALDNGGQDNVTALCITLYGPRKPGLRISWGTFWARLRAGKP